MLYDEEQMVRDIETTYKAELNNEIDAINVEKGSVSGDILFIENIPSDTYIFETLDSRLLNYTGFFLVYGIVDTPIRDASIDNYIEDLTVTVQIWTFDPGELERSNTMYKLLRYRRALKQVVMNNSDMFRGYAKALVGGLKPDAFPYSSKKIILTIGIDIKASVTAN